MQPINAKSVVLDSSAILAYLNGETGGEVVKQLIEDGTIALYVHALNLCEVYYDILRTSPIADAEDAIQTLQTDGLVECNDMDGVFWREVATLIANRRAQNPRENKPKEKPRLALGDACGLALSLRLAAHFVTADKAEIEPIQQSGMANVIFIR